MTEERAATRRARCAAWRVCSLTPSPSRCETFPPDLPDDVDLMIEAKDKEQAVLHLHRIYQLQPIVWSA